MTIKRTNEIMLEAERRVLLWLLHSTFTEMCPCSTKVEFEMSIGLAGYPFQIPLWMKNKNFSVYLKDDELLSNEYNNIITSLFYKYRNYENKHADQ